MYTYLLTLFCAHIMRAKSLARHVQYHRGKISCFDILCRHQGWCSVNRNWLCSFSPPFFCADIVVVVGVTAGRMEWGKGRLRPPPSSSSSFVFCLSSPFSPVRWPLGLLSFGPGPWKSQDLILGRYDSIRWELRSMDHIRPPRGEILNWWSQGNWPEFLRSDLTSEAAWRP